MLFSKRAAILIPSSRQISPAAPQLLSRSCCRQTSHHLTSPPNSSTLPAMAANTTRLAIQLSSQRQMTSKSLSTCAKRHASSAILLRSSRPRLSSSQELAPLAANPPSNSTPTSFFTPSLCRTRSVSTTSAPNTASQILDWNTFFRLRTSRRRYALSSSIVSAVATTGTAFVLLTEIPDAASTVQALVPTDPFISMGLTTFAATFLGWLIGPAFGNGIWRLLHRSRLPEFTVKEKAFFERIKRHRVDPTGASTNNPVPDFYGEKVGSVGDYRRWLKDQRAFNRKKGGKYPTI